MAEILPGVYIEVRPEALIVPGPVSVGNIGIIGTAASGPDEPRTLSSFAQAVEVFGDYDEFEDPDTEGQPLTLVRALEIAYANGASTVIAVRAAAGALDKALEALLNQDAHIIVAAGQGDTFAATLMAHLIEASNDVNRRERMGVLGSSAAAPVDPPPDLPGAVVDDGGRMIFVAPGIRFKDRAKAKRLAEEGKVESSDVVLPGSYAAAAVAGMLAARAPHVSLTNKTLTAGGLEKRYNAGQLESLVSDRFLALEERRGFRVVKGITTSLNTAWHQITTRRIVDFAKIGVRSAAEPYIGLLNNDRVRKALKGSINGFLAGMVNDEMLVTYELDVTATRDEQIRGIARVVMTLQPTFSIDFIKVVMFLG